MEHAKSGNTLQKSWRELSQPNPRKLSQYVSDDEMQKKIAEHMGISDSEFNERFAKQIAHLKQNSSSS